MNCVKSASGEHEYQADKYGRDDMGFYLDCVHCGHTQFFDCDTEEDLYDLFELNDNDRSDYSDDD